MTPTPRRWELFIIQHAHIDIGYTHRQETIADYQRQFIAQAVALALDPAQAAREPDSVFKFTCEGFWAIEQFLARASQQERDDLIRALRNGILELSATYVHLTELLDQGHLHDSLRPAVAFAQQHNIPLTMAMSADVNGFSWGMADALYDAGVRFLSTNINVHHGNYPFETAPVPFYWESPHGNRVLVWSGMAYHKANILGLMGGWSPDIDPGIPGVTMPSPGGWVDVQDISMAERKVLAMVEGLEQAGYQYNFLPLMGSGLYTDNSPPTDAYCRIIAEWNRVHGDRVHIRTATLGEFFQHLLANVPDIPTFKGDWPDWWSEGAIATPLDTLIFRNAQRVKRTVELLDPEQQVVGQQQLDHIAHKLIMYAEHTFGYSHTSSASLLSQQIFARKSKLAIEADELAGAALEDVLRSRGEGAFTARRPFSYRVINQLPLARQAVIHLPVDFWEVAVVEQPFQVIDETGKIYRYQVAHAPRGRVVAVMIELGPNEERLLSLVPGGAAVDLPEASEATSFENHWYRIGWVPGVGINTLVDRTSGHSLLDGGAYPFGAPVYQIFPGGNRSGAAGFAHTPRTIPQDEVTVGNCTSIRQQHAGPIFYSWVLEYQVPGASSYALEITCYPDLPQIDLTARVRKLDIQDPEGMYIAFPLAMEGASWYLDKPGGPIRPGTDQLPGTCCDYYMIQNGAALAGPGGGVVLATPDTPMVQIGHLRLWNYSTQIEPVGPLFSWLTNNKWETNFKQTCGGAYEFRYTIEAGRAFSDPDLALNYCHAHNYPLVIVRE